MLQVNPDLLIVVIHLTSDRNGNDAKRELQLIAITERIEHASQRDVILVGDFNTEAEFACLHRYIIYVICSTY